MPEDHDWLMGPDDPEDPPTLIPEGGDSMDITPETALREALQDLAKFHRGPLGGPAASLTIFLWNDDRRYETRFFNAGMTTSQMIGLLEIIKARLLSEMNMTRPVDEG